MGEDLNDVTYRIRRFDPSRDAAPHWEELHASRTRPA